MNITLIMSHPLHKTVLCRYYPNCNRGEQCSFAHGKNELRLEKRSRPRQMVKKILQRPGPIFFESFDELAPKFGDLIQHACTQSCGYCPKKDILFSHKTILDLIPAEARGCKEITTNIVASSHIPVTIQTGSGQVITTITLDLKEELQRAVNLYLRTPEYKDAFDTVVRAQLSRFDISEYESEGVEWIQKIIPYSSEQSTPPSEDHFLGICKGLEPEIQSCKLYPCGPYPNAKHTEYSNAYWMPIPTANVLRYLWFKYPEFVIGKPADPYRHGN